MRASACAFMIVILGLTGLDPVVSCEVNAEYKNCLARVVVEGHTSKDMCGALGKVLDECIPTLAGCYLSYTDRKDIVRALFYSVNPSQYDFSNCKILDDYNIDPDVPDPNGSVLSCSAADFQIQTQQVQTCLRPAAERLAVRKSQGWDTQENWCKYAEFAVTKCEKHLKKCMPDLQNWVTLQENFIIGMVQAACRLHVGADIEECNLPIDKSWGNKTTSRPVTLPLTGGGTTAGIGSPSWNKSLTILVLTKMVYNALF